MKNDFKYILSLSIFTDIPLFFFFTDKPTVSIYPPNSYNITEKMTALLRCKKEDANPTSIVLWQWFVNDKLINGPLSNYTIPNIQRNMSGTYNCTAKNARGTSLPASTIVNVQCKFVAYSLLNIHII